MTAEIICVGTELLLGDIVNTNAQFLSRELAELGISVLHQHVIGDNPGRLRDLVKEAKSRSDLLVFSGGLGPTEDDLTKETVAEAFGDTLHFDEAEWQKIVDFFARTGRGGRTPTANNRKQAMVPTKGHKLPNAHGTAPGAWFEDDGCIAVLMPGVPREMKAMWAEDIRPVLLQRQNCTIHSKTLRVLGGESSIASKVSPLFASENPTAAIYCKTGESEIRVTARAATEAEAETACDARIAEFRKILGPNAYDVDVPGLDGALDLSEALTGRVGYQTRDFSAEFIVIDARNRWDALYSEILDTLHGQRVQIILDEDPGYAYTGRVTMNAVESDRKTATISLKAVCDPYKLEITGSLDDWLWDTFNFETGIIRDYKALPVDGTLTLTIPGTRRPCIPTITASSAMTATFGGKEYALTAGDNRISGICITEGDNVLTFAGNGTVSIDYRGGRL